MERETHTADECQPGYHRFYSLEPQSYEDGSMILVISVCSNCGKAIEYRTSIKGPLK
jgi:hypothetical protein